MLILPANFPSPALSAEWIGPETATESRAFYGPQRSPHSPTTTIKCADAVEGQKVAELALQQAAAQGCGGAGQCAVPNRRNPHRKSLNVFAMGQFTTLPNPFATDCPI